MQQAQSASSTRAPANSSAKALAVIQAASLGRTLVVAPHPDDETLGCGGLLALLAQAASPVLVVLVSDGAASHPQSASHPAERLSELRLQEMRGALVALGFAHPPLWTMGLPDGAVPHPHEALFDGAVARLEDKVHAFRPDSVVLPWRHDAHRDHRGSHAIAWTACSRAAPQARRLEYAVWPADGAERSRGADNAGWPPQWSIATDAVIQRKTLALEEHRSQLGQVIQDDKSGFVLPHSLRQRCRLPEETYFDTTHWTRDDNS